MMNSSTAITLNDRFSLSMRKPQQQTQGMRSRSRSRSRSRPMTINRGRGRQQQRDTLQGSQRNRALLSQLERQHKMRMALKLKNVRIKFHDKRLCITYKFYNVLEKYHDHTRTSSGTTSANQFETCRCDQKDNESS
jgi:hypothetical protein